VEGKRGEVRTADTYCQKEKERGRERDDIKIASSKREGVGQGGRWDARRTRMSVHLHGLRMRGLLAGSAAHAGEQAAACHVPLTHTDRHAHTLTQTQKKERDLHTDTD
jgi:hypothetical protein